tara:strand:- start:10179 stop:11615 length:1437 start_codon:yes stop_codon:yes gene_type:complete
MKHKKNIDKKDFFLQEICQKLLQRIKQVFVVCLVLGLSSCSDFVEIDPPKNTLIAETVFEDEATVESALANLYYKMREDGMSSERIGLSPLLGAYCDDLDYYLSSAFFIDMYTHSIVASNNTVLEWWTYAYNIIYGANDIIKGLDNSESLSQNIKDNFKGQALFVRAYMHSLLVNIYGDVPYIKSISYIENNTITKTNVDEVYVKIIEDLNLAISMLSDVDSSGENVIPNKSVANALLARMYLYTEKWTLAEQTASKLISSYTLEQDVSKVFLKGSPETIWQFKPDVYPQNNSLVASLFIIQRIPGQSFALTNSLLASFEPNDLRQSNWTSNITSDDGLTTLHFPYKYKETFNTTNLSLEYSILFRLAEQYLIRAEARANLSNIAGAQQDLNTIRNRAGLGNTSATNTNDLIEAILQERRVELFTEQGHRWFDLKRLGKAKQVISPIKPGWNDSNLLFPIPENELILNPNLKPQNTGY